MRPTGWRSWMPPEVSARAAIAAAAARMGAVSDTARLDAELLMAHAMGVSRDALILRRLDDAVPAGFAALVERRMEREPLAYITGTRAFWTIELSVGPGVLIPRPDSETLIEAAVEHFAGSTGPGRILDLGTGPGTLLLAALSEWPGARGMGVDESPVALDYAARNARTLGLGDRAAFRLGDWARGVAGPFDLILCNPPYIGTHEAMDAEVREHEPAGALFAGADGLDDYRRIMPELPRLIAPGGMAAIEIGWTQAEAVAALVQVAGLGASLRRDLAGRARCIVATH